MDGWMNQVSSCKQCTLGACRPSDAPSDPRRCVAMLADLLHAPDPTKPCGTSTIGSSEAILLGGLALKRRWQARRKAEGKSTDKPNIVMGSEVHVSASAHTARSALNCIPSSLGAGCHASCTQSVLEGGH